MLHSVAGLGCISRLWSYLFLACRMLKTGLELDQVAAARDGAGYHDGEVTYHSHS